MKILVFLSLSVRTPELLPSTSFPIHHLIKLRGPSPQAKYTDRATAAVGEVVPTFAGRGCYVVSATDSTAVNLEFLARSCYFFFQVAPQL
jgi:hypothetical protein